MAFLQPHSSSIDSGAEASHHIGLPDFYLLLLRWVLAAPLFYYQVWDQTKLAWGFLWEQKDWPLLDAITAMNLPQPSITAVCLVFVLLVCPAAIAIGFLTRINAGLTLLAMVFLFLSGLPFSDWLTGQTYVLFIGVALVLTLSGSGQFSFDGIFAARRRRIKRLRTEAM